MEKTKKPETVKRPVERLTRHSSHIPRDKTTTIRVCTGQKLRLEGMGNTPQQGLNRLLAYYDQLEANPEDLLMWHIEQFMHLLKGYYPGETYERFSCLPAFIRVGLKRGYLDPSFLVGATRPERTLDKYKGKKEDDGK